MDCPFQFQNAVSFSSACTTKRFLSFLPRKNKFLGKVFLLTGYQPFRIPQMRQTGNVKWFNDAKGFASSQLTWAMTYSSTSRDSGPRRQLSAGRRAGCVRIVRRSERTAGRERHDHFIQIVRPFASIAEIQPQLQPALLILSAMISQYFIGDPLLRLTLRSPQFLVYSFLLFPHVFQVTAKNG